MNDNDVFGAAERNLHSFFADRYPDRAAAQRTIVRQSILQRARREHLRLVLQSYMSLMKWLKPITLALIFFASAAYFLRVSSLGLSAALPEPHEAMILFLFCVLLTLEKMIGRPVLRGNAWNWRDGWRLKLSPAFKRMYRASHTSILHRRRAGTH
jgi:hypothetical protein